MVRFLIRRTLLGVFVMWLITMAVFALFFVTPNNVARTMAGRQASPQVIEQIRERLGLDQPVWKQYLDFLGVTGDGGLLQGNLGFDYYYSRPVSEMITEALPITISLAVGAAVIWMLLGVSNGVLSAVFPRSFVDRALTGFALFFYSMPTFLLGLLLLYFLYFQLTLAGFRWFPPGGYVPLGDDPWGWFVHMILPWVTLALVLAATYTRLTRASMLDVLGEDYIRTARSKGIGERRVVLTHGLRSALTPVVTQFGIDLGQLVGGVVVTETVFSLPGLGKTAIDAIVRQDLPVILGIVVFASAAVVVANILVDVAYAVLDPRVRLH
ncbi:MAG TPA: ABC transporter permease [Marmoricola sp.]|jgi:peptide/nickel transport system permease protein|nr:ABC transporter permease [Marmoricola sp.]